MLGEGRGGEGNDGPQSQSDSFSHRISVMTGGKCELQTKEKMIPRQILQMTDSQDMDNGFALSVESSQVNFYLNSHRIMINTN